MTVGVKSLGGAAGRLRGRLQGGGEPYVLCPADGFWFRPLYTAGKCPLCGEVVADGTAAPPLLVRIDRFWLGMAALTLASMAMAALVLYTYFTS